MLMNNITVYLGIILRRPPDMLGAHGRKSLTKHSRPPGDRSGTGGAIAPAAGFVFHEAGRESTGTLRRRPDGDDEDELRPRGFGATPAPLPDHQRSRLANQRHDHGNPMPITGPGRIT